MPQPPRRRLTTPSPRSCGTGKIRTPQRQPRVAHIMSLVQLSLLLLLLSLWTPQRQPCIAHIMPLVLLSLLMLLLLLSLYVLMLLPFNSA